MNPLVGRFFIDASRHPLLLLKAALDQFKFNLGMHAVSGQERRVEALRRRHLINDQDHYGF